MSNSSSGVGNGHREAGGSRDDVDGEEDDSMDGGNGSGEMDEGGGASGDADQGGEEGEPEGEEEGPESEEETYRGDYAQTDHGPQPGTRAGAPVAAGRCPRKGTALRRRRPAAQSQAQIDQDLEEEFAHETEGPSHLQDNCHDHQPNNNELPNHDELPIITYGAPRPTPEDYDLKNVEASFQNIIRVCEGVMDPSSQSSILHSPHSVLQGFMKGTTCTAPASSFPRGHVAWLVQQCFWAEKVRVTANLVGYLRFMHLRTKLQKYVACSIPETENLCNS